MSHFPIATTEWILSSFLSFLPLVLQSELVTIIAQRHATCSNQYYCRHHQYIPEAHISNRFTNDS